MNVSFNCPKCSAPFQQQERKTWFFFLPMVRCHCPKCNVTGYHIEKKTVYAAVIADEQPEITDTKIVNYKNSYAYQYKIGTR
jgi:hypothetical protein